MFCMEKKQEQENIFEKFYSSYTLDLASAFWIFGVIGSAIAGLIFGYLSEAVHSLFIWAYYGIVLHIIIALVTIAGKYIKKKQEKKESPVWGYLTYIYCGLGFLGLIMEALF
jgi:hypothetical protein